MKNIKNYTEILLLFVIVNVIFGKVIDISKGPKKPIKLVADIISYNTHRDEIYCRGNVRIYSENGTVRANEALVNLTAKEIFAFGNVVFTKKDEKNPKAFTQIYGESLKFNYEHNFLHGENFRGESKNIFFSMPYVLALSKNEGIGCNGYVTTCNLPHPHYRLQCKEIEIYYNERVFAKDAVLYFDNIPLFYFPFYSKTLGEGSPWNFTIGHDSELGFFVKLGYLFRYKLYADNKKKKKIAGWKFHIQGENYSHRGLGILGEGKYSFYNDRFKGEFFSYFINDKNYDIGRRKDKENEIKADRYTFTSKNRWILPDNWIFRSNIEAYSDPDIYQDFFDSFERGSLKIERGANASLSKIFDEYYLNINLKYYERLNQNSYEDYLQTWDNDIDFDDIDYYKSSIQTPIITLERKYFPLTKYLVYKWKLEFFNVMDPGVMPLSTADDSWIRGFLFYNNIFFGHNLTSKLRYLNKSGFSFGYAHRESDKYGDNDFFKEGNKPFNWLSANYIQNYYDKIDDTQLSFFTTNSLTYKFADNLKLYAFHSYETSVGFSYGDFYRKISYRTYKDDIYPFPEEQNYVGIGLIHKWNSPHYSSNFYYNENLRSNLYPDEPIRSAGANFSIENKKRNFAVHFGPAWSKINKLTRETSGKLTEYSENVFSAFAGFKYKYYTHSKKKRYLKWWLSSNLYYVKEEDEDPNKPSNVDDLDEETSYLNTTFGWKISKKWFVTINHLYDIEKSAYDRINISLIRDLHCWILGLKFQLRQNLDEGNEDYKKKEFRFSFNLALKTFSKIAFFSDENYKDISTYNRFYRRLESVAE